MSQYHVICISLLMISAVNAFGADPATTTSQGVLPIPDYTGDLLDRSTLTGKWDGARTALANNGVQFDIDWTQYLQGVTSGGRDTTTQYGGHLDYLVHFDLMRMGLAPGAFITLRAESRYGNSVNSQAGVILPVNTTASFPITSEIDEPIPVTITDLNYTQYLSEKLAFTIGKLDTLDADLNEFASGRGKSQFMDANFIFNSALALRLPYSTLGVAAVVMPTENISIQGSLVATMDSSTTSGFDDFDDGLTATVEVDTQYRLGGLPGGLNVGMLYSFAQDFPEVGRFVITPGEGLSVSTTGDTWAIYASTWQYLFVKDPNDRLINLHDGMLDHEGFGVFARMGVADNGTNPVEWSGSIGIGGRGMIHSRHNDTFGVGYYYTSFQTSRFAGTLGLDDHSQGAEAYYNFAITPAARFTFDIQLQDPVSSELDTAVLCGMRLNLTF